MRSALLVLLAASSVGCQPRPARADIPEIAERYRHRYDGPCTSWLRSYRTGFEYCASPAFTATEPLTNNPYEVKEEAGGFVSLDEGPTDKDALRAHGEKVYGQICVACHQADGNGLPGSFPPLVGAGEYYGDAENMSRIIVHGLNGEIVVKGVTYNGAMPAQGAVLSDYDIAAVASFVRTSWGNDDGLVMPDDVAKVR
jgi:mono/diheme cytochrome c family protein